MLRSRPAGQRTASVGRQPNTCTDRAGPAGTTVALAPDV